MLFFDWICCKISLTLFRLTNICKPIINNWKVENKPKKERFGRIGNLRSEMLIYLLIKEAMQLQFVIVFDNGIKYEY